MPRLGIHIAPHNHERLQRVTMELGTTQSELLAAVVSVMSDEEIKNMLARYRELGKIEAELEQVAKDNILQLIRGKSPEDLKKILAAAQKAGKS